MRAADAGPRVITRGAQGFLRQPRALLWWTRGFDSGKFRDLPLFGVVKSLSLRIIGNGVPHVRRSLRNLGGLPRTVVVAEVFPPIRHSRAHQHHAENHDGEHDIA